MTEIVRRVKIAKSALLVSKPKELQWSTFQQAVFDNVENGKGHTVVQAVAGSGKTTTLVKSLAYTYSDESAVVLAFSRAVADELQRRVPQGVEALTSHALGLRAVRKAFGKIQIDTNRTKRILGDTLKAFEYDSKFRGYSSLLRVIELAKSTAADTDTELLDLMQMQGVYVSGETARERVREEKRLLSVVIETLKRCKGIDGTVDFDDMIWLPYVHNLRPAYRYDRVFVDEAQDLNAVQVDQVIKLVRPNGRILVVGDRAQSCYGFRGADEFAIDNLKNALDATELPLSVCYRCGTNIVARAQRIVPQIQSPPGQHAGVVIEATETDMIKGVRPGHMIVSRFNSPMIRLCYKLLLAGVPAHIIGRDVGNAILALIKRLKADSVDDLRAKVIAWGDHELERAQTRGADAGVFDSIRDKRLCVLALCDSVASISELEDRVAKFFTDVDKSQSVTLSSTHRAKGLERDTIWLLKSTYPFTWMRNLENGGVEPYTHDEQERNLYYIGLTRAVHALYIVRLDRVFGLFDE